jgi:tryptophan synthase alpha chain
LFKGNRDSFDEIQMNYFERIANMNLKNPEIIGFRISS